MVGDSFPTSGNHRQSVNVVLSTWCSKRGSKEPLMDERSRLVFGDTGACRATLRVVCRGRVLVAKHGKVGPGVRCILIIERNRTRSKKKCHLLVERCYGRSTVGNRRW